MIKRKTKKTGVIIGGSGLIGGTLMYYFKTHFGDEVDIFAPNSKKLSLRIPGDIDYYLDKFRPDFVINSAIAAIDSDPQLAFEVNYLGSINLALKALELGIPYIHISSAATLPAGMDVTEDDQLDLSAELSNYAKSKLMAEMTLRHLHRERGLDYTVVRLAIVYGTHDHKIQGFHRLLFSIIDRSMPLLFTGKKVLHSFTNAAKLPHFIHHALEHREEFRGQTFNIVDRNPVELGQLIITIKRYLELRIPKEIYVPYVVAKTGKRCVDKLIWLLARIGVEARMPAELMFLANFYQTQTLSCKKLASSSFVDPYPDKTVLTELPNLIQYYLTRWEQLSLVSHYNKEFFDPNIRAEEFLNSPKQLLDSIHHGEVDPFSYFSDPCGPQENSRRKSEVLLSSRRHSVKNKSISP